MADVNDEALQAPDWEAFGRAIMENWFEHCDVDAADKFDFAKKFGILVPVPGGFDPESHVDNYGDAEAGDPWFALAPTLAAELLAARAVLVKVETERDAAISALGAIGALPEGYCFCFNTSRDARRPEHLHTGECQEARAAIIETVHGVRADIKQGRLPIQTREDTR